ncbi:MAG: plasmid mobilization relaxosome protein MobC [Bacteroidota bacterium]
MARPKKSVKREKQYSVRLTLAESKRIEKNAARYGLSVSNYLRNKGLDNELKPLWTSEEKAAYQQLIGMANNLNQLTRYTHEKKLLTVQLLRALEGVNKALDKLR